MWHSLHIIILDSQPIIFLGKVRASRCCVYDGLSVTLKLNFVNTFLSNVYPCYVSGDVSEVRPIWFSTLSCLASKTVLGPTYVICKYSEIPWSANCLLSVPSTVPAVWRRSSIIGAFSSTEYYILSLEGNEWWLFWKCRFARRVFLGSFGRKIWLFGKNLL